jgi:hypothetical protein
MSLLPLTLSISLCLIFTCLVFFLREQARRPCRNAVHEPWPAPDGATPGTAGWLQPRGPCTTSSIYAPGTEGEAHENF